jgi:hypothetical protein
LWKPDQAEITGGPDLRLLQAIQITVDPVKDPGTKEVEFELVSVTLTR